nr:signal peptidase complex subunit spc2 [Quercus suber]
MGAKHTYDIATEKGIDPAHNQRLRHHHGNIALHHAHHALHHRRIRHGIWFTLASRIRIGKVSAFFGTINECVLSMLEGAYPSLTRTTMRHSPLRSYNSGRLLTLKNYKKMAESKISPHSLNELKNTTDDALSNYLRGLHFVQNNSKLDIRLAIGYVSVIIAGATFVADYKLGWEATKHWTLVAVVAYAILNTAFTYWMWAVEKGLVFEGNIGAKKIVIYSKTKKHDPTYYLTVSSIDTPGASPSEWHIKAPFTTWFTADGYFVAKPFQQWLASSIVPIGDVDIKNAKSDETDGQAVPNTGAYAVDDGAKASVPGVTKRGKGKS